MNYHSKEEIAEQFTNIYCPLVYLKPWGLDICRANTFPGYNATWKCKTSLIPLTTKHIACIHFTIISQWWTSSREKSVGENQKYL